MSDPIISFFWPDSSDTFQLFNEKVFFKVGKNKTQALFSNLIAFQISTKKKLAPLISGAILTSLALVNIIIEGAGLSMIGFLSVALLVLYFGLTDYWVLKIEQYDTNFSLWISKNTHPKFPQTLINIINFRISKGVFPPFYAQIKKEELEKVFTNYTNGEKIKDSIQYYLVPPKTDVHHVLVKIDISKLAASLKFVLDQPYLALGNHKINNDAIMGVDG